jgi:hypothetical protein
MEGTSEALNNRIGVFPYSDDFTWLWESDASLKPRAVALSAVVFLKGKSTLITSSTSQSELDKIDTCCEMATQGSETATREDARCIDAVTVLPLLIACVDHSLSIILFSSTNRLLVAHRCLVRGDISRVIATGTSIAMSLKRNQPSTAVNLIAVAPLAAAESVSSPEILVLALVLQQPKLNQIEERRTGVVSNISSAGGSGTIYSLGKSFTARKGNCKVSPKTGDVVEFTPLSGNKARITNVVRNK